MAKKAEVKPKQPPIVLSLDAIAQAVASIFYQHGEHAPRRKDWESLLAERGIKPKQVTKEAIRRAKGLHAKKVQTRLDHERQKEDAARRQNAQNAESYRIRKKLLKGLPAHPRTEAAILKALYAQTQAFGHHPRLIALMNPVIHELGLDHNDLTPELINKASEHCWPAIKAHVEWQNKFKDKFGDTIMPRRDQWFLKPTTTPTNETTLGKLDALDWFKLAHSGTIGQVYSLDKQGVKVKLALAEDSQHYSYMSPDSQVIKIEPQKEQEMKTVVKEAVKAAKTKKTVEKKAAPKEKGPGVIDSMIEFLKAASSKKPTTKEEISKKLAKRFPERSPESMAKTVSGWIPGWLIKTKNVNVKTDGDGGYWIK